MLEIQFLKVDEGLIYEAPVTVRIKVHDDAFLRRAALDGVEGEVVGYVRLKGNIEVAGKAILVKNRYRRRDHGF